MYSWNCCRTCLNLNNLQPIFPVTEHCERYTNSIYSAIGLKIEINDSLPQEMCSTCINFINEIIKFRKKCEQTYKLLQDQLNNKQFCNVKVESTFKSEIEKMVSIDISDLLVDDDFRDYDDNIPLDIFQYNNCELEKNCKEKIESENEFTNVEFEIKPHKDCDKTEIIFKRKTRKKTTNNTIKPVVREASKTLKENKPQKRNEKLDRPKEEIECEYCHKVLTSRLSLRNHYKIHTGFDVVCEHCGKKFITRRLLLMHCRAKHGYEKTDKCSFCDYRASNAEQVKIHERLHTGEKPYVCSECGAKFHRKSSYLQHVAIHLPDKTVQCEQCPARFKSVTLMRIHKSRHRAPQYTFRCKVCNNSFARRRNVARHLQRVHGLSPEAQHIDRLKLT